MSRRTLLLADGTSYQGEAFGADREVSAEVVFTTGMTGYQETLTDQSYNGQIVTFTYPLIGNCGINRDDMESLFPTTAGVICREVPRLASNWRNRRSLANFSPPTASLVWLGLILVLWCVGCAPRES
ncbi:carbamoyl-phosphate synthase [Cutibacterium acnes JCM 18918]|nr:carbamoyl-phosphate synthase [Cutibacterium acnes JCM 18918]